MKKLIKRAIEDKIIECAKTFPVIMLYGPRQVGKSTLFNVLNNEHKIKANEIINLRSQKIELELALNDPNQFIKNHP
jgi:predicted AAA+ superfamily ATPase